MKITLPVHRFPNPFRGGDVYRNDRCPEHHAQFPPISSGEIGGNCAVAKSRRISIDIVTPKGVRAAARLIGAGAFTLIEILIAIFIFMLILTAVYSIWHGI